LLPALAAAKRKAQESNCTSNLRQMDLANSMYFSDNNQGIPDVSPSGSTGCWMFNFASFYSNQTNLLICPTTYQPVANGTANNQLGNAVTPWAKQDYLATGTPCDFGSYIINGWFDPPINGVYQGDGAGDPQNYYISESAVKYTGQTPIFSDGMWVDMWPMENDSPYHNLFTGAEGAFGTDSIARTCIARHACNPGNANTWTSATQIPVGAINVALFDGHVELSKLPNLWFYYWHANWGKAPNPAIAIGTPQ